MSVQPCCCLKAGGTGAPPAAQGSAVPKLPEQTASWSGRAMKHGNEVKMRLVCKGKCDGSFPDVTDRGQAHTVALNPFHCLEQEVSLLNVLHFWVGLVFTLPYE